MPLHPSLAGLAITDPSIPHARREVQTAATHFAQSQLFLDADAGRAGLRQAAAQADVLHIATHGLFRPDNPFFSALKLADGWLDVREIYRLPLSAGLVVLSACESGAGQVRGGDEVIGLARTAESATLTATGSIVGTPAYMAPEQAKGERDLGPVTDVYGLAALLFHVLTGQPPFVGSLFEVLAQVWSQPPPSARAVAPLVPEAVRSGHAARFERDLAERVR